MGNRAGSLIQALRYLGVLRVLLYLLVAIVILFAPFSGGPAVYSGWALVPSVVVPALVPIVFFVLMLDLMMSAVFRADAVGSARQRYGRLLGIDLVLGAVLVASWLPFILSLGR